MVILIMSIFDNMFMHSPTSLDTLHSLRRDLLTGKYEIGQHLKTEVLAQEYQVSRGSITRALHKLEMEGLVESEPNGRVSVIGISVQDIIDMYDMRLWLEKRAMQILLEKDHVDYSPLVQIMNLLNKENNKGGTADPVKMAELGFNVHIAMFQMCGNKAIFMAWKSASTLMQEIININGSHVPADETYRKHKLLSDCIIQKWPNSVEVIEEHLMGGSRDIYLEALENIKHKGD
ncbi:GntR family transcriptional regulator [Breznakiella homolactica]|uniref:GntR family transcriptional regulator n=1 Tax=Breznakiella homolactica TaxID=2798577 RepID=A0A7T8B9F4_9SPIR|nr:GntR family transcriptional regulator [Breznakiella homolactica]QQO09574.1 GntR family transcriptional regulator [Breznakiella homolactica]